MASIPQPGSHYALPALGLAFPATVLGIMNEMLWSSWRYHGNAALPGNTTVTVATVLEVKVTPYPTPHSKMLWCPHNPLFREEGGSGIRDFSGTKLSRKQDWRGVQLCCGWTGGLQE